jgi:hypothetical protein
VREIDLTAGVDIEDIPRSLVRAIRNDSKRRHNAESASLIAQSARAADRQYGREKSLASRVASQIRAAFLIGRIAE